MSKQKIDEWLSNPKRNYSEGLSLYTEHRRDASSDKFFNTQTPGTIHMNMLIGELSRITRIISQNEPTAQDKKVEVPGKLISIGDPLTKNQRRAQSFKITNTDPDVDYKSLPDDMKQKFDSIKELSKVIGGLKVALDAAETNDDRKKFADDLCNKWDERKALWDELDKFIKEERKQTKDNNKIPFTEMNKEQLAKAIKLRKDNINRAEKNVTEKNKAKAENRIKEWESEIDELEKLINS